MGNKRSEEFRQISGESLAKQAEMWNTINVIKDTQEHKELTSAYYSLLYAWNDDQARVLKKLNINQTITEKLARMEKQILQLQSFCEKHDGVPLSPLDLE